MKTLSHFAFLLLIFFLNGSCSSGSGIVGIEGTGAPPDSTVAVGPITAFGSIYVHGIRFDTSNARITIDQVESVEEALKLGMIVRVEGTINEDGTTGIAERIIYAENLEGPISEIEILSGSQKRLTIMSTYVTITRDAVFDGVDFNTLAVGNFVEVSGYQVQAGEVTATRIELLSEEFTGNEEVEIISPITAIDREQQQLQFQSLVIDYSNAEFVEITEPELVEGRTIEVGGTLSGEGVLIAEWIYFDDFLAGFEAGDEVYLEDAVTDFESISDFQVRGVRINADAVMLDQEGLSLLSNGAIVEIEGVYTAEGVVYAHHLEILEPAEVYILSQIQSINLMDHIVEMLGTVLVTDSETFYSDETTQENRQLNIESLVAGEWAEVWLYRVNERWIVGALNRIDTAGPSIVEGHISGYTQTAIQINTLTINTEEITPEALENREVGEYLTAEVRLVNGEIVADDIFIE